MKFLFENLRRNANRNGALENFQFFFGKPEAHLRNMQHLRQCPLR